MGEYDVAQGASNRRNAMSQRSRTGATQGSLVLIWGWGTKWKRMKEQGALQGSPLQSWGY
eukprot:165780-Pelagomonas_calceolata.AAC.3